MVELVFEIGCEEIPARFLPPALDQLAKKAEAAMTRARLPHGEFQVYGTPRRLTLAVFDLAETQEGHREKRTGPFVHQAFDKAGEPTKAALGFARSCGVEIAELGREPSDKGEKLSFVREVKGRPAREVLAELLPELVKSLDFPKAMRWGAGDMAFVRPIHWMVALLGGQVVDFALDGLKSGRQTFGHRFGAPGPFDVESLADYLEKLDRSFVMASPSIRRETIEKGIAGLGEEHGWEVMADPGLLEEVTNLVEYPVVLAGKIGERFLKLPAEVLITAMRAHQRYFSVKKPGTKKELLPYFITVANNPSSKEEARETIIRGNQRVLGARLADAEFYFNEDLKTGIEKMREGASGMVFYRTLGTYLDKTGRTEKLAAYLADQIFPGDEGVKAAAQAGARYSKADLVSLMVGEFPELQGVMGGEYLRAAGFDQAVALAVRDHYLPRSAEDIATGAYPESPAGDVVSVCDKIDSVVSCWAAGLAPTGSGDPFSLRRQVQGAANLVMARGYRFSFVGLIREAALLIGPALDRDPDRLSGEVADFLLARLKAQLTDAGHPYDVVDACLAVWNGDLVDTLRKIDALSGMKKRADFDDLMIAFRRVMNIVEGEPGPVDQGLFEHESEAALHADYIRVREGVHPLISDGDYARALEAMSSLKPAVDRFFTDVMVNVDDLGQRRNRHALCAEIAALFREVADFSRIVVEGDKKVRK